MDNPGEIPPALVAQHDQEIPEAIHASKVVAEFWKKQQAEGIPEDAATVITLKWMELTYGYEEE